MSRTPGKTDNPLGGILSKKLDAFDLAGFDFESIETVPVTSVGPLNVANKQRVYAAIAEKARRLVERKITQYYPDGGPLRRELYAKHLEFFRLGRFYRERLCLAANRVGKALKHGTGVATPNGWVSIECLRVGDQVFAGDGSLTKVLGVYPQGEVDLFSLSFDGRSEIVSCGAHLWLYQHPKARYPTRRSHGRNEPNPFYGEWSVGNTLELSRLGGTAIRRAVIPITKPWLFYEADLPLDPYLLGLLLGDGGLSRDSIKFSSTDNELIDALGAVFRISKYSGCDHGVLGAVPVIRELGLLGCTSSQKFIPKAYLSSSVQQRLALLQGLMDTDGSISAENACMEFSTCSDRLADDFVWLSVSLGLKARKVRRHTKDQNGNGLPSWRITLRTGSVCPFRLRRKVERFRPLAETSDWILHGVSPVGRGLATCIEVAHSSHTYVVEHGIVTHNTEGLGLYELVTHATGWYPHWWPGRVFDQPVNAWACGDTSETVREILQEKLLGPPGRWGTGLIPAETIVKINRAGGNVPDSVESIQIRHKPTGNSSTILFKSYDQRRKAFQGTAQDIILLDEEPSLGIYIECLLRTMTNNGMLMLTFTPLLGMSEVVMQFLPEGKLDYYEKDIVDSAHSSKYVLMLGWDDAPHLSEESKRELEKSIPAYQRDARTKGIPQLGAGAIYPVPESDIIIPDFKIPAHWPRVYALDVGWNRTAALWGAVDEDSGVAYLYSEHYRGQAEPSVHAEAIRARGDWIPGVVDPAARGRSQRDGQKLLQNYRDLGLKLQTANNARESGIFQTWQRLSEGTLKVFGSLRNWAAEYRLYRRDEKGEIVKLNDHLMDDTRYLVMSGFDKAIVKPVPKQENDRSAIFGGANGWMA